MDARGESKFLSCLFTKNPSRKLVRLCLVVCVSLACLHLPCFHLLLLFPSSPDLGSHTQTQHPLSLCPLPLPSTRATNRPPPSPHRSPAQITARLDALIASIRANHHGPFLSSFSQSSQSASHPPGDVLVVGHGHILRAFAMRWVGQKLEDTRLIMEAGGVGTLSYEHHSLEEPAILLGGGFVVTGE